MTERITGLSRQNSASLFMVLLTALDILLFRWTGQSDLVIGTVTASRNRLETEGLLGCFINFLPVRSKLSDVQTGSEVLKQTRATVLEAYNYQDCPFDLIVETVNPTRSRGINPIYNVAFVFQNVPKVRELKLMENLGLALESVELQTSLLDLRFVASETAEGISFLCEYNAELFEPETIDSLMDCYEATLRTLTGQPAANICDYELTERLAARARRPAAVIEKQMIAIASTFTAEPVEDTLRFWARKLGLDFEMTFAPFNQVFQQLLDPASLLSLNRSGANVVLLRFEDWRSSDAEVGRPLTGAGFKAIVEQNIGEMADAFRAFAGRSATPCIVCLCPASPPRSLNGDDAGAIQRIEDCLKKDLEAVSGVHVVTSSELASKYPVADYYDQRGDELGRLAYTSQFFTALGTMIVRKLTAITASRYKVIVLDCDNTLWDGICGEDGPAGVRIDGTRRFLQDFMIAQHDSGMVLCLCSRNNEQDVLEVFERHPHMVLKHDHLTARRINWIPKPENLRSLAAELGLGLDSFILVDDDPAECAAVRATCPDVLTLQLPERRELIPRFLGHVWAFDHIKVTEEDGQRTAFYRQARLREQSQQEAASLEEFIAGLDLRVDISKLAPAHLDRASQLTHRTNQFNVTGRKRSARDIQLLQEAGNQECYAVRMQDRFGDYGLVGLLIFAGEANAIRVDTFLLSCRALGKKGEHRMLAWLGAAASQRGLTEVIVPYVPRDRNQPALEFLNGVGANYKRHSDEGFLFTFPAEYAAELETRLPSMLSIRP